MSVKATLSFYLTPVKMAVIKKTRAGKNGKGESVDAAGGNVKCSNLLEMSMEVL